MASSSKTMTPIDVRAIAHSRQRYPTSGDWYRKDGVLCIRVSKMGNEKYEALIALHEFVEALVCRSNGVSEKEVTEFDMIFELERAAGKHSKTAEPGLDKRAPYRHEHIWATLIEQKVCKAMGVDWGEYDAAVNALEPHPRGDAGQGRNGKQNAGNHAEHGKRSRCVGLIRA